MSDDLISRQAAIDAIVTWTVEDRPDIEMPTDLVDRLLGLPSAQPERKEGKWRLNREGNWACPFCKFDPYHDEMNGMNYCPNCGARLKIPPAGCGAKMEEDNAKVGGL